MFGDNDDSLYTLKIKDTSANPACINVTKIKSSNGVDISDSLNDSQGQSIIKKDSSDFNDKLYITFTVTKPINSLIFICSNLA